MRQYLALLKDSFREALASRVLAFTLAGIVLILALLAPFGLSRNISTTLRITEVSYPERLYGHLASALRTKKGASEEKKKPFHFLEQGRFDKEGAYFDRACNDKFCDSSLLGNAKSLFKRWASDKKSFVFIIRNFNYLK